MTSVAKVKRKIDTGVLFYINNNTDPENQDLIGNKLQNISIESSLKFRTIHVVDNRRAAFLFDSLTYVKNKYGEDNVNFFYPSTTLNIKQAVKTYHGKILPVEFISSPVIPLVIENKFDEQPIFCLIVDDDLTYENLELLVAVARDLVSDLTKNISFLFPNYNEINHKEDIDKIKINTSNISGKSLNIKVGSFRETFLGWIMENNSFVPWGDNLRILLQQSKVSRTDIRNVLKKRGVFVGSNDKNNTAQ